MLVTEHTHYSFMSSAQHPPFTSSELLSLYTTMVRIRAFENAAEIASQGGVQAFGQPASAKAALVKGPLHLSTGQEAVPAGVCAHLAHSDLLTSTHRGHGHTLAKGADPVKMMCELFGRSNGYNKGKGGSMHIADFSVGMLGANGVVTAGLAIAVGAAQALKLQKKNAIAVSFFGDGAINRGPFLESLNWAVVYQLPVLFVCEDNRISATTDSAAMTAGEGASARAASLGLASVHVNGNDVEAVSTAAKTLIDEIRQGSGPRLLHAITYRHKGHVSVDPGAYRDPAEVAKGIADDPIVRLKATLLDLGLKEEVMHIDTAALQEIAKAVEIAQSSPFPKIEEAYTDITNVGQGVWQ